MANTTIKITQLQNIGNGLAANTLLPVVNTTGSAITQKVTVGNVANFALSQAGNTLAPAFLANLAYSVANAAQPNITSVGTLNVNTLKISGGTNGYFLQTDGTGNVSWSAAGAGGNGSPGGSNAQLQFNNEGEFGGDANLIWNLDTQRLLTSAIEPGAIYTDNYFYANGDPFSAPNGSGNVISNYDSKVDVVAPNGNVIITTDGPQWIFDTTGNLTVPGNLVGITASPAPSISGFSSVNTLVSVTTPVGLSTLTAIAGGRAFISDANLVAAGNFGAQVGDGGSNTVPVWSDGTDWYIG